MQGTEHVLAQQGGYPGVVSSAGLAGCEEGLTDWRTLWRPTYLGYQNCVALLLALSIKSALPSFCCLISPCLGGA